MLPGCLKKYGKMLILGIKNKRSLLVRIDNCNTLACLSNNPEYASISRIRELSPYQKC